MKSSKIFFFSELNARSRPPHQKFYIATTCGPTRIKIFIGYSLRGVLATVSFSDIFFTEHRYSSKRNEMVIPYGKSLPQAEKDDLLNCFIEFSVQTEKW